MPAKATPAPGTVAFAIAAFLFVVLLLAFVGCADTKHVGDSRTWQDKSVGDMGHGAGDGGISQWLAAHPEN